MRPSAPLPPEALYTACDPASFDFDSTETLPDLDTSLIHVRAIEAMHMSLDIRHEGYNLFVLGETGSGRHAMTCCACPAAAARACGTTCSTSSPS